MRSAVFKRSLVPPGAGGSSRRRINPTEPVVAALWLGFEVSRVTERRRKMSAYRGSWLALSFALI